MGFYFMFGDAETASDYCGSHDSLAPMPVEGGYMVLEWSEYYRRIQEEAESLYDRGWRSTIPDFNDTLLMCYDMEDTVITREWAEAIQTRLYEIERYRRK